MRWAWVTACLVGLLAIAGTAAGALAPQDDAGSGRDAPGQPADDVTIASGESYDGLLEGFPTDTSDHYAFEAEAGDTIEVRANGLLGCAYIKTADGTELAFSCTVGYTQLTTLTARADSDGTYYLEYAYVDGHPYLFGLGVGEPAPRPIPTSGALSGPGGGLADVTPADPADEQTVIAVVDTGINPYHDVFAAPNLGDHPSQWIDGFPSDAQTVDLSLGVDDYDAAVKADNDTWNSLQRSSYDQDTNTFDEHVYAFPQTRVAAGISFGEYAATGGEAGTRAILDEDGHGTGSAALAAGASLAEADGDVVVVAVEVPAGGFNDGLFWAAQQPWIDAMTVSLGTVANVPYPSEPLGFGPDVETAIDTATDAGKPVYVASGNGVSGTGLTPDHCTTYTSGYTGAPTATRIGAAEPGSENPAWWHCVPVDAIAATPVPSADHASVSGIDSHSGTSAATPNAIGHWAELMQRSHDNGLTVERQEVSEQLLHEARPADPQPAVGAEPSTQATAPVDQGYGVVNEGALERAWDRLANGQAPAERPLAETFFEQDQRVRQLLWGSGGLLTGERTFESSSDTASSEGLSTAIEQPGSCGWLVDNGFGDLCAT
jgi:hypothetical protein